MDRVKTIRELHYWEGWSIRRIARELGHSRKTVRKAIREGVEGFRYRLSEPRPRPVRDGIAGAIRQLLEEEKRRKPHHKQRLTAARIEQILRKEHGFSGGSSTVRKVVAEIRQELIDPLDQAMVPLSYEPGEDAQADFFEADVMGPDGVTVKVKILLLRACYSSLTHAYAAPGESQEALLEGLMRGFEYFGGLFRRVWFDNLTPAVKKVLRGRDRLLQETFEAFCAHYCFEPRFCGRGKGNEKGGVENAVGYVRRNALVPVPRVADRAELQHHLDEFMVAEFDRYSAGRKRSIGEMWSDEEGQLISLPTERFDAGKVRLRKVSTTALMQDGRCFYSVPVQYVREPVTVKRYAETIEIYHDKAGLIARHRRLYDRDKTSFELAHYLPLLHRKVRAFEHAAPIKVVRAEWPPSYETLLRLLRKRDGDAAGTRRFIEVLTLHCHFDKDQVQCAVEKALSHEEPSLEMVRYYLDMARQEHASRSPLSPELVDDLPDIAVKAPDVSVYGRLLAGGM